MLKTTATQDQLLVSSMQFSDDEEEEPAGSVEGNDGDMPCLSGSQWAVSRILAAMLKGPLDVTTMLEASEDVTIDRVLPLLLSLRKQLSAEVIYVPKPSNPNEFDIIEVSKIPRQLQLVREIAVEQLEMRFLAHDPADWVLIALRLNPSYNADKLFSYKPSLVDTSLKALRSAFYKQSVHYNATHPASADQPVAARSPSASLAEIDNRPRHLWRGVMMSVNDFGWDDDLMDESGGIEPAAPAVDQELTEYLAMVGSPELARCKMYQRSSKFDVLKFWTDMRKKFPVLAQLAQKCFSVLASEANVERLFSHAGDVVSDLRTSLKPVLVEAWVMVPRNFRAFPVKASEAQELYVKSHGTSYCETETTPII